MHTVSKLIAVGTIWLSTSFPAWGRVVRMELHQEKPDEAAAQHVPADYVVYTGVVYGELDPADKHNQLIQDLPLAPRNANGRVEYSATFTLYAPLHPAPKAALIYEVVNRGHSLMPREYANGDYFLLSGWQGDLPAHLKERVERLNVPIARNADGTAITGPAFARWWDLKGGQKTLDLYESMTYKGNDTPPAPVDFSTEHAHLIVRDYEDSYGATGIENEVPANEWRWGGCEEKPSAGKICLKKGADPALQYELRYTAKDPLVLGIGLAAVRDINSFFRYEAADTQGNANPIAGKIKHVVGVGISQSGNYIRTFLHYDMNRDEHDRIVWDGAMPIIAARQVPLNVRFGVPGGTSLLHELGTDGTNWWSHATDPVRGNAADGLLDRCTASHSCPKIIEMMGSAEFYSLRASMEYVGTDGRADLPLPANVRRFYIAGTTHGGGEGGFQHEPPSRTSPRCVLAMNPNPEDPIRRALLLDLKQWVVDGRTPPASVYPTLAAGTLATSAKVLASFPMIPEMPRAEGGLNPSIIYEAGPEFRATDVAGIVATRPSPIRGVTASYLPTLDRDGNETGGVRTPLLQAPLGTYTGWNITEKGFRKGQFCSLVGGYVPFAKTEAERKAMHDPRPSLEGRYASHAAYVERVRIAAKKLQAQRLLLSDDADEMVKEAEASAILR